jgi:hypothetical protein
VYAELPAELDWVTQTLDAASRNDAAPKASRKTPGPDPDDIPVPLFKSVVRGIVLGVDLRKLERETGLSWQKVLRIRDFWDHPGQPGPNGGPGYHLEPGSIPGTVRLRKL